MFRRILIWFFCLLLFSFAAFVATSLWLSPRSPAREGLMRRLGEFQLSESIRVFESGGKPALRDWLERINQSFPAAQHYLIDAKGRDLVSGEDRSALAAGSVRPSRFRLLRPPRSVLKRATEDGRYAFLIELDSQNDPLADMAVYGWIVLVIVLLCYALAWTLAKPVRLLRETVVRFGQGDFSSRSNSKRRDELGDLARAFDRMADRTQLLLTAERRLLQDISHELRSPLARLRFALELAKSSADPTTAFARVNKEVERLTALVGELLQVTRAEGDPEARNVSPIRLDEFVNSIAQDSRIEAEAKNCTIDVSVQQPVTWQGDRELLHRAIENVVRNAIQHSPESSTIEVDLQLKDEFVVLRVRDYGPGIPPEELSEIFRPFYRVEKDRSRNGNGGVGLGLSIVERAVTLHHGQVSAHNMQPGLLVELRLPR